MKSNEFEGRGVDRGWSLGARDTPPRSKFLSFLENSGYATVWMNLLSWSSYKIRVDFDVYDTVSK
jgi:hypothetical protein